MSAATERKLQQAQEIILGCMSPKGVWASPARYKHQCWTRDFAIATEDALLGFGRNEVVRRHLDELAGRQYSDGRMPIMFIDSPLRWLLLKVWHSIKNRRMSFLLRQYFSKDGIGQLSPWTRDSEELYALAVARYANLSHDKDFLIRHLPHINSALRYVESSLMKGGLIF